MRHPNITATELVSSVTADGALTTRLHVKTNLRAQSAKASGQAGLGHTKLDEILDVVVAYLKSNPQVESAEVSQIVS